MLRTLYWKKNSNFVASVEIKQVPLIDKNQLFTAYVHIIFLAIIKNKYHYFRRSLSFRIKFCAMPRDSKKDILYIEYGYTYYISS